MTTLKLPDTTKLSGWSSPPAAPGVLGRAFVFPPFSVLDARSHVWRVRKRQWLALGIKSELGRGRTHDGGKKSARIDGALAFHMTPGAYDAPRCRDDAPKMIERPAETGGGVATGTSVFDPVLCEILYRWFCPPGGQVIDPFAGGSVRGVVAGILGLRYWGCDLSERQVAANKEQGGHILGGTNHDTTDPTPVERVDNLWVKRDDLFVIAGAPGGKARTCLQLARRAVSRGCRGLITAGSRYSPQIHIVALVGAALNLSVRCHIPQGDDTPETLGAEKAGATLVRHTPGHNSVIIRRAKDDAASRGWYEIPFGMEHKMAIQETAAQTRNLPPDAKRLVVSVGSGMSLAGILHGLREMNRRLPILGVVVGSDPTKRLDAYAPTGWRSRVKLVNAGSDYHQASPTTMLGNIELDPHYEAKCLDYVQNGDVLWAVGIRPSLRVEAVRWLAGDARKALYNAPEADFILTCPPYGDFERYSDHPDDLSTLEYPAFRTALTGIVAQAANKLKPDRFAAVVVGEFRGPGGDYYGFVGDVVRMFQRVGCRFYNEAVLVTPGGSLPVRTGRQFQASRKFGKSHQNVLVFCKGDANRAAKATQK